MSLDAAAVVVVVDGWGGGLMRSRLEEGGVLILGFQKGLLLFGCIGIHSVSPLIGPLYTCCMSSLFTGRLDAERG